MPEMDGFEVARYVRNKLPNVPVIVMTAYGDSNTDARLKELGVVQCLEKPLDFVDVIKKIMAA
jgi:CheY-like chemotaxis protein